MASDVPIPWYQPEPSLEQPHKVSVAQPAAELPFERGLLKGEDVVHDARRRSLAHSYRNERIEPFKLF